MSIIVEALKFENSELRLFTTDDHLKAVKKLKELIKGVNLMYVKTKDPYLMGIITRLKAMKRKVESRLEIPATV